VTSSKWRLILGVALVAGLAPAALAAQATYPNVKITGRLQVEFYSFDNDQNAIYQALPANVRAPESSFLIRRARIEARGNLAEQVSFVIAPNYTTGQSGLTLADAYLDVAFTKGETPSTLVLRVGQFKRPFGRYELTSSTNLPSLERGAYRGLVPASSSDLAVGNGYEARDLGAGLYFTGLSDQLDVSVAVMNGALSPNFVDLNGAKSFYARATYAITPKLSVGASFGDHDFQAIDTLPTPDDTTQTRNTGFGLDAQWSAPGEAGLYLMVDYVSGESAVNSANTVWGIQAVAAYHIRMASPTGFLYAIEPALRYDVAEPNNNLIDDQTTLITAGVNLYLTSRTQVRLLYESQGFEDSALSTISGFRGALTMHF